MAFRLVKKPKRIVCLTEEPTEILYLLGEEKRIVGISAYTCRPKQAKEDKPVVSAFISGSVKKIIDLEPDLIIGFSDIQGQLAKDLIEANQQVIIFNQRTVQEILEVIYMIGAIVGVPNRASDLIKTYIQRLNKLQNKSRLKRPKVYFEEWDDPMISGIRWVSELIELAGGHDIFLEKSKGKLAKERFVQNEDVIGKNPDIYIASWCGKKFNKPSVLNRPGWTDINAIKRDHIYELDPSIILQPGPACLSDGLDELEKIIK